MTSPLLGTAYLLSLSPPTSTASTPSTASSKTPITPTICASFSHFKSLLQSSRSLDDSIILRLNRASALSHNDKKEGCEKLWDEMRERWRERGEVLGFCGRVAEAGKGKGKEAEEVREETGLDRDRSKLGRGESEAEVLRRQLHNEVQVEAIIRLRSLALFTSRCPSHSQTPIMPPLPGEEGWEWEDKKGRDGRGGVRWNGR